ncbi:MAG: hypothetical protein NW220_06115 [Leptolyngbyaceae cyanobacterium bins.349]|nr:hypothetical protein [Leptolyngbyaceae cyanobacterium bins.349]
MSLEIEAMAMTAELKGVAGQPDELTLSETYSRSIVGPVAFKLSNLNVRGRSTKPAAPANSPYIIAGDETYDLSVDIEFNRTPLSELLMCLGTQITIYFSFEGFGRRAVEIDLSEMILTRKDVYSYRVTHTGVAGRDGLVPGLYSIAATAEVGPVRNACSTKVFGHGYIKEVLLQVYPAGAEI